MKKVIALLVLIIETISLCSCSLFDKNAPELKLSQSEDTLFVGDKLPDYLKYVRAKDDRDGDITSSVVVNADKVNMSKAGTYKVYFSVADKAGNESSSEFTVHVISHNRWDPVVKDGYYTVPFDLEGFVAAWNETNPDALFTYDAVNTYSIDGRDIKSEKTILSSYVVPVLNRKDSVPFGIIISVTPSLITNLGFTSVNAFSSWKINYETLRYWAQCHWRNSEIDGSNEDKIATTCIEFACKDLFKVMFPHDDYFEIWTEFVEWIANDNTETDRVAAASIKSEADGSTCFHHAGYEFSMACGQNLVMIFCRAASE